jgi:hypothetical protein
MSGCRCHCKLLRGSAVRAVPLVSYGTRLQEEALSVDWSVRCSSSSSPQQFRRPGLPCMNVREVGDVNMQIVGPLTPVLTSFSANADEHMAGCSTLHDRSATSGEVREPAAGVRVAPMTRSTQHEARVPSLLAAMAHEYQRKRRQRQQERYEGVHHHRVLPATADAKEHPHQHARER